MKLKIVFLIFLLSGEVLFSDLPMSLFWKKDPLMDINMVSNIVSISPKYGLAMVDGGDKGTNLNKYIMPKIEYGKIVLNHQNRKLSVKFGNKKTYLILVALNKYKDKNMNLVASISDVKKISNKIRSNTKQIIEYQLFDNEATKDNIIAQFKKVLSKANKDDVIVLYWVGHGLGKLFRKYMIPYDFSRYDNLRYEAIAITELEELAKKSKKSVILLFDGCFLEIENSR
jgi:hypothetical protein